MVSARSLNLLKSGGNRGALDAGDASSAPSARTRVVAHTRRKSVTWKHFTHFLIKLHIAHDEQTLFSVT